MSFSRRSVLAFGVAAAAMVAAPAVAQDQHGWFTAGINAQDYIFHTGERGVGRRSERMTDADELRSRIFEDSLQFPPPEGLQAVSIRSRPNARPGGMGTLSRTVPAKRFRGKRIRLSANLKTDVAGRVQMWMRVNGGDGKVLSFDDMQGRALRGTNRWKRYSIVLQVPANAVEISYGFLLAGSGAAFANEFALNATPQTTAVTGGPHGPTH